MCENVFIVIVINNKFCLLGELAVHKFFHQAGAEFVADYDELKRFSYTLMGLIGSY